MRFGETISRKAIANPTEISEARKAFQSYLKLRYRHQAFYLHVDQSLEMSCL